MYDASDPRASLQPRAAAKPAAGGNFPAQHVRFSSMAPQEEDALRRQWWGRGQNFVASYVDAREGAVLERKDQPDEYMVLIPEGSNAALQIDTAHGSAAMPAYSVAIVPAGASSLRVTAAGDFVLLYSTRSADLCAKAANREGYEPLRPNVAPLEPWPQPTGGPKPRVYSLDVPPQAGRFGRIWRCTTFMVNYLASDGPRDVTKMSPHHHDDFEQGSFLLRGEISHHLRWPWVTDMRQWLDDDHEHSVAPSLTVIPPPAIHTSNASKPGRHVMIDVFCPPRIDFSLKPGWVLNADEYPMPAAGDAA